MATKVFKPIHADPLYNVCPDMLSTVSETS